MSATFAYLSWLRRGLATAVQAPAAGPRAAVRVELAFNAGRHTARRELPLLGPGDIVSLAPGALLRQAPDPGAGDAETTGLVLLELAEADLPWRFTPDAPNNDRLSPWLCLLVLREGDKAECGPLAPADDGLPPRIRVAAGTALPDPAQAWAWAHVQLTLDGSADPVAVQARRAAAHHPERLLARLLCPRRLEPDSGYTAVLVPLFEGGRLAGLGRDPGSGAATRPAWARAADGTLAAPLELPVYHRWSFRTGPAGDFESLVRRLRLRHLPPGFGWRPVDAAAPGPGLPSLGEDYPLPGVLLPLAEPDYADGEQALEASREQLFAEGLARRMAAAGDPATPGLAPPLYGRWPAGRGDLLSDPDRSAASGRPWLDQLNGSGRLRAAAGAGAQVVRRLERELMAEAWEQAGDVLRANEALRRAGLAREAAGSAHRRHLVGAGDDLAVHLAGPLAERIDQGGRDIAARLEQAGAPAGLLDPALRRVLRPGGALGRRRRERQPPLAALADGSLRVAPPPRAPGGMAFLDDLLGYLADGGSPGSARIEIDSLAGLRALGDARARIQGLLDPARNTDYRPPDPLLAQGVRTRLAPPVPGRRRPARRPVAAADLAAAVRRELDPARTIPRHYGKRLQAPPGSRPSNDPLDPVILVPRFPRPLVEPLAELSQEWLLPGLEAVPADSIALLRSNRPLIEACLAGANHEMARELLWNGYPTDPAGTFFHRFWERSGYLAPGTGATPLAEPDWEALRDVADLHTWRGRLGDHAPPGHPGDTLVLLLRGRLLQRYPAARVLALPARTVDKTPGPAPGAPRLPVFSGRLDPDVAFFGFDLGLAEATGDPGWFFAIQEPVTEQRFGLDADGPAAWPASRRDLAFSHLGVAPGGWIDLNRAPDRADAALGGAHFHPGRGATAATVAELTRADPVQVLFHAGELLGRE